MTLVCFKNKTPYHAQLFELVVFSLGCYVFAHIQVRILVYVKSKLICKLKWL